MEGGVVALGNFDGVHRGHQAVIRAAVEKARSLGVPAKVLTFEPHPRLFFQPTSPPFRLTPFPVKQALLKAFGVDEVIPLPFTAALAHMPAEEFVEKILIGQCGVQHLVAGHDFIFGARRGGDMAKLRAWLEPKGVGITDVEPQGEGGEVYSSTEVRELLLEGQVEAAAEILGRDWSLQGKVIHGAARGHLVGIPTANISLGEYLRPKFGVYAIHAGRVGAPLNHRGVANIGLRPTVDGKSENLEAHLFDFAETIYGQEWQFALKHFIRPELKFDSMDALKAQIVMDIEEGKRVLNFLIDGSPLARG